MINHRTLTLAATAALFALAAAEPAIAGELPIIPKPVEVIRHEGKFVITPRTAIVYFTANTEMKPTVEQLATRLRSATGFRIPVVNAETMPDNNYIFFNYLREEELGHEGYRLEVNPRSVEINAHNDPGFFYGMETLLQLLPPSVFSPTPVKNVQWEIPSLSIMDKPRFSWRGMHLDVSRHFFPKEFIYTYLDLIAMHKMNVFHWHLTDDQGWRIEIKKYPKLTSVGAWRVDHEDVQWDARPPEAPGEKATYGGFYTQKEIRDIVAYAKMRNITIVPEIEMPAHTVAALAAYPQFSCTGGPFTVATGGVWPITNIYCAGNDSTFLFLQDVLTEVMDLFPGQYIHIGGDEADKTNWKACPKCQARIRTEGLKDEGELQSYFIKRIEKFVVKHHRKLIGWDEILEGGLPPEATVMSWRGTDGGIAAARQQHDVVMTPGDHCYFDHYQGRQDLEPAANGGYLPLSTVYEYEPVPPGLNPSEATHVLGAQANVWTEFIPTPAQAVYMVLPRMAALAEVLWSPKDGRTWLEFIPRIEHQLRRYDAAGYTYARSAYAVNFSALIDTLAGKRRIALGSEIPSGGIHFATGTDSLTAGSPLYREPFSVDRTTVIRAGTFRDGVLFGKVTTDTILAHRALLCPVTLARSPDPRYPGKSPRTLTDGMTGSLGYGDGAWLGFLHDDFEAVVDLGTMMPLSAVSCRFLQTTTAYIFFPTAVMFEGSSDGKSFVELGRVDRPIDPPSLTPMPSVKTFRCEAKSFTGRFIRVRAKSVGNAPAGYHGAGEPSWIFVDEIVVE
jgi:hexosaminidase